jgi:hypothetical protein
VGAGSLHPQPTDARKRLLYAWPPVASDHRQPGEGDCRADLLNLASGVHVRLYPVGTTICEQLTGSQSLAEILGTTCEQSEVTEEAARQVLLALISRLRDEGLIAERR